MRLKGLRNQYKPQNMQLQHNIEPGESQMRRKYTDGSGRVVNIPASHSGGTWFKYEPGDCYPDFFAVFLNPSTQLPG
jgi:hypothetical protein